MGVNINFCSRTHCLLTIHNNTDRRQTDATLCHKRNRTKYDRLSLLVPIRTKLGKAEAVYPPLMHTIYEYTLSGKTALNKML